MSEMKQAVIHAVCKEVSRFNERIIHVSFPSPSNLLVDIVVFGTNNAPRSEVSHRVAGGEDAKEMRLCMIEEVTMFPFHKVIKGGSFICHSTSIHILDDVPSNQGRKLPCR